MLTMFKQFGFVEQGKGTNDNVMGRCPLCGKDQHFFVNTVKPNHVWDCKACSRSGGYQKFLQQVIEVSRGAPLAELATNRGLTIDVLKMMNVGRSPVTGDWLVPVYSVDGKTILNIKIYDGDSFRNTAGCTAAMYGLREIPKEYDTVYIAEGEWDSIALIEMLAAVQDKGSAVIGVPGAGTFKADMLSLFQDKRVYLLYDNDLAGENGKKKAEELLRGIAFEVLSIQWPAGKPKGHDVRDVYVKDFGKNAAVALDWLHKQCVSLPASGVDTVKTGVEPAAMPIIAEEVYTVYKKWLHLPSMELIDVIYGTILANRFPGDPVWMFVVAPPGATKTEPLMSLANASRIETISTLTPHSLISGANFGGGGDPSLIPQLNGKVLIIKDFTAVLGLPAFDRENIFSILRDAYDGECTKVFGNGVVRKYKSRFGIIAGVTPVIEHYTEEHAQLGERFLRWRNWIPEDYATRRTYINRALKNATKEVEMRAELSAVARKFTIANYTTVPSADDSIKNRIVMMAQWISTLRATVIRDHYTRDVQHKPFSELGTRLSKELYKLVLGVSSFRGWPTVRDGAMTIAASVARSSISARYLDIVRAIFKTDPARPYSMVELKGMTGLPAGTTDVVVGNLVMLNVLYKTVDGKAYQYTVTKEFQELTINAKVMGG